MIKDMFGELGLEVKMKKRRADNIIPLKVQVFALSLRQLPSRSQPALRRKEGKMDHI